MCDQVIIGIVDVSGERKGRGVDGGGVRVELVIGRITGDTATGDDLGDFGDIIEAMLLAMAVVTGFLTGGTELVAVGMDFSRRRNGAHGGENVIVGVGVVVVVVVVVGVVNFHGGKI